MLFAGSWSLELIIEDQNETASNTPPNITDISFEKAVDSLLAWSFPEAVHGARVLDFDVGALSATLHHEFPAHSVQRERDRLRGGYNQLREEKLFHKVSFFQAFLVSEHPPFTRVVAPEVESPVYEDSGHWDREAFVEASDSVDLSDFTDAVTHSWKLTIARLLSDVRSQTGSSEVKRVYDWETDCPRNTYII